MYAVIRPALRSASQARPPARYIQGRRYPQSIRLRLFHSSLYLANTSNPPPGPENPPVDENDADKKSPEKTAKAEQPEAGVATEDPEVLAQKLQRSREMTRRYSSALRRSQRRNRAQDLPPVHIPQWFLDYRVALREEADSAPTYATSKKICSISIKNKDTGELGTCSLPFFGDGRDVRCVLELVRAMHGTTMSTNHFNELQEEFIRRIGMTPTLLSPKTEGPRDLAQTDIRSVGNKQDRASLLTLDKASGPKTSWDEWKASRPNLEKLESLPEDGHQTQVGEMETFEKFISPLVLFEARATVAACLSATQPAFNDSFPSSKTNIILHAPSSRHGKLLKDLVLSAAAELDADVVSLDAQDLAQLAGDYLGEGSEPSPHSVRSLGYETYKSTSELGSDLEELGRDDGVEDEAGEESPRPEFARPFGLPGLGFGPQPNVPGGARVNFIGAIPLGVFRGLRDLTQSIKSLQSNSGGEGEGESNTGSTPNGRIQSQSEIQLEDLKLLTLLEVLVDSTDLKRARVPFPAHTRTKEAARATADEAAEEPKFFDFSINPNGELDFSSVLPESARLSNTFTIRVGPSQQPSWTPLRAKIIYISDIKELQATYYGSRIIQKLEDIVRKQRSAGENVMIIGTTSSSDLVPEMSASGVQSLQSEGDAGLYRTIVVPFVSTKKPLRQEDSLDADKSLSEAKPLHPEEFTFDIKSAARARVLKEGSSETLRFHQINLRHIEDMLRSLDPKASEKITDFKAGREQARRFGPIYPESCSWKVLSYDEVHRIAVTALGLFRLDSASPSLTWAHVALSMGLLEASDEVKFAYVTLKAAKQRSRLGTQLRRSVDRLREEMGVPPRRRVSQSDFLAQEGRPGQPQLDLERIALTATKHEKRLMHGIVNPDQIKTTFDHVHVPKDTVEAIRTLTSLSLLRPDAFNYGVLATDKISGVLLYGPPGTGKTLLAKAVAKESGSSVLEVSGSEINDKYVGEGEKNVRAIFTLAQKLSPCIVFLDEADAIFGARDGSRQRVSHRDILNQFLKEWDGLNDASVFVMVASNRPFDLDDAVIRRLPRRLLVDLPTQEDRQKILQIHLRGEQLHESVDLVDLAKRTPLYSGSDLKNVAVSAALACVREENEQAAVAAAKAAVEAGRSDSSTESSRPDSSPTVSESQSHTQYPPSLVFGRKYEFPEKRILHSRHFDKALQEISASISEDMSSLNAIKKFDEQYGDRKGRRKKNAYGFGVGSDKNEAAARVRH
ncbi:AAA-domain-containing protein [Lindgomyces ingoldianus]|uniref:AAA-domain-containing protein n=1 Tax=Lindgomyces ingoldianus TaxID=673940 RepID=A0ACB6QUD8_9PLEO|nr:AAA-domain-containing protein [Lindgomyces ingoldianus]KAF2470551.1 AAA-domain-containing protein [Lindgomyces ingoldianus]